MLYFTGKEFDCYIQDNQIVSAHIESEILTIRNLENSKCQQKFGVILTLKNGYVMPLMCHKLSEYGAKCLAKAISERSYNADVNLDSFLKL